MSVLALSRRLSPGVRGKQRLMVLDLADQMSWASVAYMQLLELDHSLVCAARKAGIDSSSPPRRRSVFPVHLQVTQQLRTCLRNWKSLRKFAIDVDAGTHES